MRKMSLVMYKLEPGFVSCLHKTAIFINSDVFNKFETKINRVDKFD